MKVAVLIVNWNSWRETVACLESVFRGDLAGLQVVVCDNASTDGSLEYIRRWARGADGSRGATLEQPVDVVEHDFTRVQAGDTHPAADSPLVLIQTGANRGFAGGNNAGLQYLLQDPEVSYVWLLNPDTVVDPGAVRVMVELAEAHPDVGIVGSKILFYDEPERIQAAGGGRVISWQGMTRLLGRDEMDRGQWDEVAHPDYITGCSMLVRAEMLRSVGLMDERYFLYSEEVDWCIRARQQGWSIAYCPTSRVWHKEGRTVGKQSARGDYYSVRSQLLLTEKFHPRLVPVAFAYSVFRCLLPKVVRRDPERFRAVLRAYRDFLRRPKDRATAGVTVAHLSDGKPRYT